MPNEFRLWDLEKAANDVFESSMNMLYADYVDAGQMPVVLANKRMAKIGDSPTAKELGIPVSLSTVRGFVTKKGAPADRVKQLEAGMMKAMSHNYYKNFLTEIGLDETSVVGADEWGKQMEEMLAEMTAQLKALGYIN